MKILYSARISYNTALHIYKFLRRLWRLRLNLHDHYGSTAFKKKKKSILNIVDTDPFFFKNSLPIFKCWVVLTIFLYFTCSLGICLYLIRVETCVCMLSLEEWHLSPVTFLELPEDVLVVKGHFLQNFPILLKLKYIFFVNY